jgi:hypothetical protein
MSNRGSALVLGMGLLILIILIISYIQFGSIPIQFTKKIDETEYSQSLEQLSMLEIF